MNLIRRLTIANAVAVVIPFAITVLVALAYIFVFGRLFGTDLSFENYQHVTEIKFDLIGNQNSILNENPEVIQDINFQHHLQDQLSSINGELIILQDDQILFFFP
jgi:hypothetical protein